MSDLVLGLTVALVGMAGTLIALSVIALGIYILGRAFPEAAPEAQPTARSEPGNASPPPNGGRSGVA